MDFILNKIIKRSITALIGPTFLYSVGYGVCKALDLLKGTPFLNQHAALVLLGVSLIYPLNKIGLMITLKPIEAFFNYKLKVDPSKNFALRGNFAPVREEMQYQIDKSMIREGAVPTDVNGVFLRNGPNPMFMPPHGGHFWFDGDGHIHGLRIKNGKAYYCNRQT